MRVLMSSCLKVRGRRTSVKKPVTVANYCWDNIVFHLIFSLIVRVSEALDLFDYSQSKLSFESKYGTVALPLGQSRRIGSSGSVCGQ